MTQAPLAEANAVRSRRAVGFVVMSALLPGSVSDLMDRCGIVRALPKAFADFSAEDLAREMRAPENQPMRRATIREISDADIDHLVGALHSLWSRCALARAVA